MRNDPKTEIEKIVLEVQQSNLLSKRKIEQLLELLLVIYDEQKQNIRSFESIIS